MEDEDYGGDIFDDLADLTTRSGHLTDSGDSSPIEFNLMDLPSTSRIPVHPYAADVLREEEHRQAVMRGEEVDDSDEEEWEDYNLIEEEEEEQDDEEEDEDDQGDIAAKEREFSHGTDWRYKVPFNKDGSYTYCRDISSKGSWALSSCKSGAPFPFARGSQQHFDGYGVDELLDDDVDKYWQSDGPQPHSILVEFNQKVEISWIMLYLDYKNDESYTPSKILIQLGSSLMHLEDGKEKDFNEPIGWQAIDMRDNKERPARTFVLQLQILQNHQNGRDTHVRHMRILTPIKPHLDPVERMQQMGSTEERGIKKDIFRRDGHKNLPKKFMNSLVVR